MPALPLRPHLFVAAMFALSACSSEEPSAAPSAATEPAATLPFARLVVPHEVALYQATKVPIFKDGVELTDRNAPVVAGRRTFVRLFVSLADNRRFQKTPLVAEMHFLEGEDEVDVVSITSTVQGTSSDVDLGSTLNFDIPGEKIKPGRTVYFVVKPSTEGATDSVRHPKEGALTLGALSGAERLNLVFVPVQYQAEGKDQSADLDDEAIEAYRVKLHDLFPVGEIDVTRHAPLPWAQTISPTGAGWDALVDEVIDLRRSERARLDVFYVALFKTAPSLIDYCKDGRCVLGIAPLVKDPRENLSHVAIVTNYPGSSDTMAQELAHAMGRLHAPCGDPPQIDKSYPYPNAHVGTWGFSLSRRELIDPSRSISDFLSYCAPNWTSDYTFAGLFSRISTIHGVTIPAGTLGLPNGNEAAQAKK